MKVVTASEIDAALTFPALTEALAEAFRGALAAPGRHHHAVPRPGRDATLLLMPAWTAASSDAAGGFLGVKVVTVFPDNAERGEPSVQGVYLLLDGATGRPLAALDGTRLTLWRTAAASALAARHLARPDASRMAMVGTGALAPFLVRAHAAGRALDDISVWGRDAGKARALAAELARKGFPARAEEDLRTAVERADIVSCATLSAAPLVRGAWLSPGTHLDLVGAFNLDMREADDDALQRASVHVDTPAALSEGGDVAVAIRAGAFRAESVRGDLAGLVSAATPGRTRPDEITLFKSIGASLEDLAAAILVWRELSG